MGFFFFFLNIQHLIYLFKGIRKKDQSSIEGLKFYLKILRWKINRLRKIDQILENHFEIFIPINWIR